MKLFNLLLLFFLFPAVINAQQIKTPDFIIIDTLFIENPIVVIFSSKRQKGVPVFISESQMELLTKRKFRTINGLLFNYGYYGIDLFMFKYYISKVLNSEKLDSTDSIQMKLLYKQTQWYLEEGHKIIYPKNEMDPVQKYNKHIEISQKVSSMYIVFLVKGATINSWTEGHSYKFKDMDNLYVPVLVPAPWIGKDYDFR
jgi:hypothetical protein